MAGATQVNPAAMTNEGRSYLGISMTGVTIDYAVNGTDFSSTEMGPAGAHPQVIDLIGSHANIVAHSGLRTDGSNAGQVWDCWVKGDRGTDTWDGTNSETFAAFLQTEIRTLTSVGAGSVDLSSATVVAADGSPMLAE
jgi:hypothetical protein|tara:strand:- start:42 stop:455 length:414 start_codon:yes stop_codon:yes gene_type:complete